MNNINVKAANSNIKITWLEFAAFLLFIGYLCFNLFYCVT